MSEAERAEQRAAFLDQSRWSGATSWAIAGDASQRQYWRLEDERGATAILMDDPGSPSGIAKFVAIAGFLVSCGLAAPEILERSDEGFLILTDLGLTDLAKALRKRPHMEGDLYSAAIAPLTVLERLGTEAGAPFAEKTLTADEAGEMVGITTDALGCDKDMSQEVASAITRAYQRLPIAGASFALRDYHAENLIWRPNEDGLMRVGLLDFQDALHAPVGYDLASLLGDVRRDLTDDTKKKVIDQFAADASLDRNDLVAQLAILSAQRNLRILGVFMRLIESGKPRYQVFLGRTRDLISADLSHDIWGPARPVIHAALGANR